MAHHIGKSFKYAGKGLSIVWRSEPNFRIQLFVGLVTILAGVLLAMPVWKLVILILMTVFVLVLEVVNSIFERLADAFEPRIHTYVREMKDLMAGAVLLSAITAFVLGLILFWPYIVPIASGVVK